MSQYVRITCVPRHIVVYYIYICINTDTQHICRSSPRRASYLLTFLFGCFETWITSLPNPYTNSIIAIVITVTTILIDLSVHQCCESLYFPAQTRNVASPEVTSGSTPRFVAQEGRYPILGLLYGMPNGPKFNV